MENIAVYEAINAVQDDMAKVGISKDKKNVQQGYNFRGIDDVYGALAPLLAKHKLCIIPFTVNRTVTERTTKSGGALFYVTVDCEFHFVSAVDGSKHIARTFGEAMDSGDKATNKAMSSAYKYAAFQTFCIPVDVVDADAETHEVIPKAKKDVKETAPEKKAQPVPEPQENIVVFSTLKDIQVKSGKTNGKDWKLFTLFTDTGDTYGTFDEATADLASSLIKSGDLAKIEFSMTTKGNKQIVSLEQ
jgi:hypothetical protein